MKLLLRSLVLGSVGVVMSAASAWALPFAYSGDLQSFNFSDPGTDGFSDQLSFSGLTVIDDGSSDSMIGAGITIADLFFTDTSTGTPPAFFYPAASPGTISGGFQVDGFFTADLTVLGLEIYNDSVTFGSVNAALTFNLSDIVSAGYAIGGGSLIADSFISSGGGAVSINLTGFSNPANLSMNTAITSGQSYQGMVTGTAKPAPEPATMLLLGTGLAGLAGMARRRAKARA